MPGPKPNPVESDLCLPKSVDVVIVGGGIIGVSTALELAERGNSVLLCEKGQIGAEQSSRNWGWVRLGLRDPREIPLMTESLRIWQSLDERIGRKTGYVQSGILFGARTDRSAADMERWLRNLEGYQTGARMVSGWRWYSMSSYSQPSSSSSQTVKMERPTRRWWIVSMCVIPLWS